MICKISNYASDLADTTYHNYFAYANDGEIIELIA